MLHGAGKDDVSRVLDELLGVPRESNDQWVVGEVHVANYDEGELLEVIFLGQGHRKLAHEIFDQLSEQVGVKLELLNELAEIVLARPATSAD